MDNFNEKEVIDAIKKKIAELEKESFEIDLCRGKGIALDKSEEIGHRQREIESEISKLKTQNNG